MNPKPLFWIKRAVDIHWRLARWLVWNLWKGMTWKEALAMLLFGFGYAVTLLGLFRLAKWI